MTKSSHKRAAASRVKSGQDFTSQQGDLFQQMEQAPKPSTDLALHMELLGAIATARRLARARGLGPERILDRMNYFLGEDGPITQRQLNGWTAASQEFKEFPARYLPAFCAATECDLPLRVLVQPLGLDLIDAREAAAKRLGETYIATAQLKREQRDLQRTLGG